MFRLFLDNNSPASRNNSFVSVIAVSAGIDIDALAARLQDDDCLRIRCRNRFDQRILPAGQGQARMVLALRRWLVGEQQDDVGTARQCVGS